MRYDQNVVLWQGGNRLEADQAVIDRSERTLTAKGNVRTLFTEQTPSGKEKGSPRITLVQSQGLSYSDRSRTALYTGGVTMKRGGLDVAASVLRGLFSIDDGATVLESAVADGNVRILQPSPGRTRKATAEHGEYVVKESKVILSGGSPEFTDSLRGTTRGRKLTWFADNDRLLIEGQEKEPAVTRIRRN
jgi:lipopolysaccharide export system protein LptA